MKKREINFIRKGCVEKEEGEGEGNQNLHKVFFVIKVRSVKVGGPG